MTFEVSNVVALFGYLLAIWFTGFLAGWFKSQMKQTLELIND